MSSTEIPTHMIDNEYITGGYRVNHGSIAAIIRSLFRLHNEFVNVWSHFLGALFFTIIFIYTCYTLTNVKSMTLDMK